MVIKFLFHFAIICIHTFNNDLNFEKMITSHMMCDTKERFY